MAVFLINICKFNGCGITFPSLSDLISHIEDTHIDYDPKVVEQKEQAQPACLPLSYVLRFISDDARKETSSYLSNNGPNTGGNSNNSSAGNVELKRKLAIKHHSYSMSSSNRSNTPTGSEMDEDEMVVTESEDSNDSWTTEEFSSEFIMRYGSRHSGGGSNGTPGNEKPFACPVPGCKKRYKNVNGIKYHSKNGHKKDGKVRKGYKCHCGKSYKTAQGLKNHALMTHNTQPESVLTTQQVVNAAAAAAAAAAASVSNGNTNTNGLVGSANNGSHTTSNSLIQRSGSPSQSLGSLSPSSISNMSSSASSCHGGSVASSLSSSNAVNNNNNAAGSMLQQLSNGSIVTVTNVPPPPQQQSTQPQQNASTQSAPQQMQIPASASTTTTETSYSCSYMPTNSVQMNSNNINDGSHCKQSNAATSAAKQSTSIRASTAFTPATAAGTIAASTSATSSKLQLQQQQSAMTSSNTNTTSMQISPTFIEHKYSAFTIKEKFFASLRNTSSPSTTCTISNKKLPAAGTSVAAGDVVMSESVAETISGNVNANGGSGNGGNSSTGNMMRAVAVGKMCALQNEHIHQNLYKKTIN